MTLEGLLRHLARVVLKVLPLEYNPVETTMSNEPRMMSPKNEQLPQDVVELISVVSQLPDQHRHLVEPIVHRVAESTRRRKRILGLVQEALGQLRLDMKYLMFDLEATRRERDTYLSELEGRQE